MNPYEYVKKYKNLMRRWIIYHIICFICFLAGLIAAQEYMFVPDEVIAFGLDRSIYQGRSMDIASEKLEKDIATRACYAFLERGYQYWNRNACQALFGKGAMEQVERIVRKSEDHFKERKLVQLVKIEKNNVFQDDRQSCRVFITGKFTRIGTYLDFHYQQVFAFRFNVKLIRSNEPGTYPMRIAKVFYEEKELYNDAAIKQKEEKK